MPLKRKHKFLLFFYCLIPVAIFTFFSDIAAFGLLVLFLSLSVFAIIITTIIKGNGRDTNNDPMASPLYSSLGDADFDTSSDSDSSSDSSE